MNAIAAGPHLAAKLERGWSELADYSEIKGSRVTELSITNSRSFTVLLESITEGVLLIDADGKIIYANSRAHTLFGSSNQTLLGLTVDDLVPESVRNRHAALRADYVQKPSIRPMGQGTDLQARRLDGSVFPAEISLSFLEDKDDRVYVAFITDITARKQQEAALLQTGKFAAIGELAGNIAHEVNNPIAIILAKAHLLMESERGQLSPKALRELEKIVEQCERLGKMTRGLLDFSRPSLGEKTAINLHQPIHSALGMVYDRAQKHQVEILERLFASPDLVLGNPNELQQVFLNLFLNAIDAMPGGGRLTVSSEIDPASREIVVHVADNGEGMEPEIAAKVFEPFFTTKEKRGTGLGLSICLGLVRSHKGTITVTSRRGQGATFTLRLPVSEGAG